MDAVIVPFTPFHAYEIVRRNEEVNHSIFAPGTNVDETISCWYMRGAAFTLLINDEPVCCGGIVDLRWKRGEVWTLTSPQFFQHKKTCYSVVKFALDTFIKSGKYRRVQSIIDPLRIPGDSWMRHLGFEKEGTLRAFGINGEDLVVYSRVAG